MGRIFYPQKCHLSGRGLWGLINNAGISAFGDVEWTSIDIYKRVSFPMPRNPSNLTGLATKPRKPREI